MNIFKILILSGSIVCYRHWGVFGIDPVLKNIKAEINIHFKVSVFNIHKTYLLQDSMHYFSRHVLGIMLKSD